jgi:hypothetical protein
MRDGFVLHGAEGALGGVIGTLLVKQGMTLAMRMPERLKPPAVRRDPGDFIVSRIEALRGRPLPGPVHERVAGGLHWAYGIAWGGLLGIAVSGLHVKTPRQTLLAGAGLGALVWAVGYVGWLPGAGLMAPIQRQGAGRVVTSLASHVLYGVAASVPIVIIDRERRRRQPWWQRLVDAVGSAGRRRLAHRRLVD